MNFEKAQKKISLLILGILIVTVLQYVTSVQLHNYSLSYSIILYGLMYLFLGYILRRTPLSNYDILFLFGSLILLSVIAPIINKYNFPLRSPGYIIISSFSFYISYTSLKKQHLSIALFIIYGAINLITYLYTPDIIYSTSLNRDSLKTLPQIKYEGPNSKEVVVNNDSLKNKVVILEYWSTSCVPCLKKFSALKELKAKFKSELTVLAVNNGKADSKSKFIDFVHNYDASSSESIRFVYDVDGKVSDALGVKAIPHEFLVDGNGNIIEERVGYNSDYKAVYIKDRQQKIFNLLNK